MMKKWTHLIIFLSSARDLFFKNIMLLDTCPPYNLSYFPNEPEKPCRVFLCWEEGMYLVTPSFWDFFSYRISTEMKQESKPNNGTRFDDIHTHAALTQYTFTSHLVLYKVVYHRINLLLLGVKQQLTASSYPNA